MKSKSSKVIGIFIVAVILIGLAWLFTSSEEQSVSLGSPCTTAGEIIEAEELTFECQEIESVLIWQTYSEESEAVALPDFSSDPLISPVSILSPVD